MFDLAADKNLIRDPLAALERHFGFREFLAGQEPVVSSLLAGRDTLAVMPTGGGKSLCYQLPAMVMEGVTLVISPLIALMKDQVDGLVRKGVPATMINSTLSPSEQSERLRELEAGKFKLVYIAPERFRSGQFIRSLQQVPIAFIAVDEAHCLSQWGHDFRPDYLRLSEALERLDHPQTAAFTATATPEVQADILQVLKLREPYISISGFERPNLSLRVSHCEGNREKYDRLHELIRAQRTGIVYCSTRKRVEEVSASLSGMGVKLVAYHGGMDDKDREWAQNVFLDRSYDVAVATNAFGMGIDRADVRFVAHFDVPGSIEAYYQEAGRAGRDGEPAECDLLFNYADTRTQEFFLDGNNPGASVIRALYRLLRHQCGPANEGITMTIKELTDLLEIKNSMQVSSALSHLVRTGYIERFDVPGERARGTRLSDPARTENDLVIDEAALREKERRDRSKLDAMVKFSYDTGVCRQQWILEYFGESDSTPCGTCDICCESDHSDRRPPGDEEHLRVRKALSGIARTCARTPSGDWEGRFGKGKIVQMLTGAKVQELKAARLDQLSTFGILKGEGSAYVSALITEMEKVGLVAVRKTPYPLLGLTRRGAEVMKGDKGYRMVWPDRGKMSRTGQSVAENHGLEELAFDEDLFDRLKEERKKLAEAAGGVPPYVIFGNQVLEIFTRLRPTTESQALKIHGVGKVKAERYLEPFLQVIRDFGKG
ncbi:MAG: RecQ family ATP-dependent DNA helicase [Verrucomicrobiaceae bacterium]|nr:RecQ family ATP-dependent DNA helicase [Verrucomicrobiaceae bacterium]